MNYEFKPQDAFLFANKIGARVNRRGDELRFVYCPNCKGGPRNDKNTFSINLKTGQCKCQRSSCGYQGNMITLSRDFGIQINDDISRYYNIQNYNGRFRTFKDAHRISESTDAAVEYMKARGIPEAITRRYEITIKKDSDNVLVFPFKDENGELRFIKYRNITFKKGESLGAKEWCESNCMPILFGMNHCDPENPQLIITEGQIDSLSVVAAGFTNVVSVPTGMNGFTWVPHCWDWIHQFKEIVVFGDYEKDRISLLKDLKRRIKLRILCVRPEDYKDCKDANEILLKYSATQIRTCISQAKPELISKTIELANVKDKDIYEMPKVKTGFYNLDRLLRGGLPFGGVTIVSGKPGEGKSTLASQLLISAVEQGYSVYAYSGELPNYVFKQWIDFQIAGKDAIEVYKNDTYDFDRYYIPDSTKAKISQWYAGKFFMYDNDLTKEQDDAPENLLDLIERNIMQNNIKVVLIDNLMTALDLIPQEGFDRNDQQSRFMKKLTAIGLHYNVCIILVAHRRKNNHTNNDNDEISGSGDIANLGLITLAYQMGGKDAKTTADQRVLTIAKNRLFGTTYTKGWVMDYDPASKRIYNQDDELTHDYGWNSDGWLEADSLQDEIPF